MVWIPGGMFEVGTGASYDGSRFARDGVVCVTINYRVGAEGFLYLADGDANLGLLDQIAALEWVRENIAAFGGDPANVTIFGESAGAMSVGTLLAVPRAEGLFRRAIAQSGAADRVIPAATSRCGSARVPGRPARHRGDPRRDGGGAARAPARSPRPSSRATCSPIPTRSAGASKSSPACCPGSRWWTATCSPRIRSTSSPPAPVAGVDVMVGRTPRIGGCSSSPTAPSTGHRRDPGRAGRRPRFEAAAAYGVVGRGAGRLPGASTPAPSPGELLAAIETDWWCRIPALRLADAHAPARRHLHVRVRLALAGVRRRFGACHALEIPLRLRHPRPGARPDARAAARTTPPQALADAMHGAWVAFAATGDPGWPRYDPDRRATMRFDTVSRVVDDPRSFERGLWSVSGGLGTPVAAGSR